MDQRMDGRKVGMFDPSSNQRREWPLPGNQARPYAIFDDDHHFVWLGVWTANALVPFDMLPLPHVHANVDR
jgi:streptogramin lyase